jgi:hypothetical protein
MNIPEEIVNQVADQMAKDIDTLVLLSALGWNSFYFSEGTVYEQEYLTAKPAQPLSSAKWKEMEAWMVETFGPTAHDGVWTPNMRWYTNNSKFWFRDKKDLEWFLLRWQ